MSAVVVGSSAASALWVAAGDSNRGFDAVVLADRIRVQGPDHPNVLSTRYAIAVRTRDTDDPERATAVFSELLLDSVRVLGEHHPHTGLARYRLALSERDVGRTDQALEHLAIVHATWINRFGPDSQLATRVRDLITSLGTRSNECRRLAR